MGRRYVNTLSSKEKSHDVISIDVQSVGICIKEAVGNNDDIINGYHDLVPNKPHNFRPQYQKVGDPDKWLMMMPDGSWWVTDTKNKESNNNSGWCHSGVDHHTLTPDLDYGRTMPSVTR